MKREYICAAFIVLVSTVYMFLPSPLDPVIWKNASPLKELVGIWFPNHILNKTEQRLKWQVTAPESMAIDPVTGDVYASLNDGRVVRINVDSTSLEDVLFIGGRVVSGTGNGLLESELLNWCQIEAKSGRLAWNETGEVRCGRPLGLRFKQNIEHGSNPMLYVLDAYHGLFTLDIKDGTIKHVFDAEKCSQNSERESVPFLHKPDNVSYLPCRFMNDLDVSLDGTVYFTDSSYKHSRSHNREEIIDGAPRGRLLTYYPDQDRMQPLLCGLHFPNGVQLLPDENVLIVAESCRFRLLKIDLSTLVASYSTSRLLSSCGEDSYLDEVLNLEMSNQHTGVSIFSDALPGFLDNIRLDSKGDVLYVGMGTKASKPFSFLWLSLQSTVLRGVVGKLVPMKYVEKLVPKYGFVAVLGLDGTPLYSLHDPTGNVMRMVSEAQRHPITGDLWMGSHSNPFIGILRAEDLKVSQSMSW